MDSFIHSPEPGVEDAAAVDMNCSRLRRPAVRRCVDDDSAFQHAIQEVQDLLCEWGLYGPRGGRVNHQAGAIGGFEAITGDC